MINCFLAPFPPLCNKSHAHCTSSFNLSLSTPSTKCPKNLPNFTIYATMEDFIESSTPAVHTGRKFPAGFDPDAPKTGADFNRLTKNPNFSSGPNRKPALAGNSSGSYGDRERVLGILKTFRRKCKELLRSEAKVTRVDFRILTALREEQSAVLKLSSQRARSIGAVPGVEVEDRFEYRAEMLIVGLHKWDI